MSQESNSGPVGVWLVGARGAIASCVAYGLWGLRQGLIPPVGLVTARPNFAGLQLVEPEHLVLAGHEVARRSLSDSAAELVRLGVLPRRLVAACSAEAAAYEARIRPGLLDGPDVGLGQLDPAAASLGAAPPRQQVERLRADFAAFIEQQGLERLIVVDLTSTEAAREPAPEWRDLASFEAALDAGRSQPASVIYAYAALGADLPHVNFTPNPGASIGALRELARVRGVAHCGDDGKTGETLVKTALGPMFPARNLKVLSWQGYNMLGNRDGEVLSDPLHKRSKLRNKDAALRSILDDEELHSHVGIDYVPSLGDWKTAWDYVHFEGFLGARMSMQFTWQGSDSALAAPLVIDLVRLCELAARRGETGVLEHTASFFKSPLGGGTHDFHAQYQVLLDYAQGLGTAPQDA